MPTGKTLLCTCEDVTLTEVRSAFAAGYRDVESVKRYTGFGTGPCQGKSCLALVTRELLRLGATPAEVAPFTIRPPADPVTLAALAGLDPAGLPLELRPSLMPSPSQGEGDLSLSPRPSAELPSRADVVIVGGGIMGLSLAYQLARRGITDVVVLESGYLNAGASGRNGGGVRAQWTTPTMIRLARRSIELCRHLAVELGINVWMRQGGYLFLAPTPQQAARIEKNAELHRKHGLRTRILTPPEAREVVPELDERSFLAASWNPDDAVVFPWPYVWGYAARAEALGAKVLTFTGVRGFEREGRRVTAVVTDRGTIACDTVVNAAGAWSRDVAALAGVKLPNEPERHEILVTEPLKPWLGPLVSNLGNGLYFSQSLRGEIVGGMGDPEEPPGIDSRSTLRFLARFSRAISECVPAVAELMADWMAGDPPDEIFERFTLARFDRGEVKGEDFIIG